MAIPLAPRRTSGPPAPPILVGPPPASAIPPPHGPTMGFAAPVSGPPGSQPLFSQIHQLQPAVPLVQPAIQMAHPVFQMSQPVQPPMIQPGPHPMMQPMMQPGPQHMVQPMMQPGLQHMMQPAMQHMMQPAMQPMIQPAFMPTAGHWPSMGAQPAGVFPVSMPGGVGYSQPQQVAHLGQPVSAPPKPTHAASPNISTAQPTPGSGTARRVHFEDETGTGNRTTGVAGTPSTGASEQEENSRKKRRLEDAVDWIYDHTIGKCQLCGEHGHLAPTCHKLKESRAPMAAVSGAVHAGAGPFTEEQSKWRKTAGQLSFICQNLLPDPDCKSLSHSVMLQHLLELLCENEHNAGRVYHLMTTDVPDKGWWCVRSVCERWNGCFPVNEKCRYCLVGEQLVNFCLQIQPRKDQLAMYREIPLVKT